MIITASPKTVIIHFEFCVPFLLAWQCLTETHLLLYLTSSSTLLSLLFSVFFFIFLRWSTTDADIKVPSVENPELTDILPLKTGVSHNITMHASLTARNFFLVQKCLPSRSIHRHFLFSPRAISAGMTVPIWRSCPSPPPRFLRTVVVVVFTHLLLDLLRLLFLRIPFLLLVLASFSKGLA